MHKKVNVKKVFLHWTNKKRASEDKLNKIVDSSKFTASKIHT